MQILSGKLTKQNFLSANMSDIQYFTNQIIITTALRIKVFFPLASATVYDFYYLPGPTLYILKTKKGLTNVNPFYTLYRIAIILSIHVAPPQSV